MADIPYVSTRNAWTSEITIRFTEEGVMDKRIVYGVNCCWWDSIDKVAKTSNGLPCCPNCGGVLFEMEDEDHFMLGVKEYEVHKPGYALFVKWLRGKCFRSWTQAWKQWEELGRP